MRQSLIACPTSDESELNDLWPAVSLPQRWEATHLIPMSWNWIVTAGISFVCFLFYIRVKLLTKPQ